MSPDPRQTRREEARTLAAQLPAEQRRYWVGAIEARRGALRLWSVSESRLEDIGHYAIITTDASGTVFRFELRSVFKPGEVRAVLEDAELMRRTSGRDFDEFYDGRMDGQVTTWVISHYF